MSQLTAPPKAGAAPEAMPNSYATGKLPKYVPWAILAASFVVVCAIFALFATADPEGGFNAAGAVFLSVVLYGVVLYVVARMIEGPRRATDRLVTTLVTLAFIIALLPLISLLSTARPASTSRSSRTRCATSWVRAVAPSTPSRARSS
jgi:phosphate transport system permease protein